MRLSDVKGDRTLDAIADIIEPIANIAEDEVASELFVRKTLPDGMTPKGFLLKRARQSVPALLKNHKADVIAILSTIEGTSPKKYAEELDLAKLFKDCIELLTDEVFIAFFTSEESETGGNSSGSAAESFKEEV